MRIVSSALLRTTSILLICLFMAGCVTTKKRFKRGVEREVAGQYAEAAEAYLRVLQKDRNYPEARERLQSVGLRAIESRVATANQLEQSGAFDLALGQLDAVASLRDRAGAVGVTLAVPDDLESRRTFLVDAALDQLTREAEEAVESGQLEEAMRTLERARSNYPLTDERRVDLDHRLGYVLIELAQQDIDTGQFRSAYDTAYRAIEILDQYNDEAEQEARLIAFSSLARGVRRVAVVPLWQTDLWRRVAPPDLRSDINDAISFGEVNSRPPFLEVFDIGQTRRMVTRLRMGSGILTRGQARDLGERLEVHYVLSGELTGFTRDDNLRRSRIRETQTRGRGGVDTTYQWRDLEIKLVAQAEWRVLDVARGDVVLEGTAAGSSEARVERATYAGNWETLDLTGSEIRLFDPEEWLRQDRDLMIALSDDLAANLMRQVDDGLLRLID